MYGTVARIKVKPEMVDEALDFMRASEDDSTSEGAEAIYLYQMDADPNEFFMVVLFEDKEAYFANADDPQTDAGYKEMAKFFAAEPEWHDGEIIYAKQFK